MPLLIQMATKRQHPLLFMGSGPRRASGASPTPFRPPIYLLCRHMTLSLARHLVSYLSLELPLLLLPWDRADLA
jgi:hypothetical protein